MGDLRIAVISPFVDRRHGTERAVCELIERLAGDYHDQVDLYAQRVADLQIDQGRDTLAATSWGIRWQPVAAVPGPLLLQFPGWLYRNRRARRQHALATGDYPDVVFSPGINALDADVILVHAVFHRLAELQAARDVSGPRGAHRKLYYSLLCRLERRIYRDPRVSLAAVSKHTAEQLARFFGRRDIAVIPNGVDTGHFSPATIVPLREAARQRWQCASQEIVLLLIGNDWRNKGLSALLEAMALCQDLPVRLLVVGQDERAPFLREAETRGVRERVEFLAPMEDVRSFYAAADVLLAPSLEDSFNLPALEAMACGLPVVVSPQAGISEWLVHGEDSWLLKNPQDAAELADAILSLAGNAGSRRRLAENAVATARKFSWDEHAAKLRGLMEAATAKKKMAEGDGR